MSAASGLLAWAGESIGQGSLPYLLLDSAQAENSHLQLNRLGVAYKSLFDGKAEESVPEIAPLLIPLSGMAVSVMEQVCEWAMQLGYRAPCLSWMASDLSPTALAAHLQQFHTVDLSEGQRMMMRWYDTRILPVWLACLDAAQKAQFTAGLFSLHYVNRFGDPTLLFSAEAPAVSPGQAAVAAHKSLIALNDAQYSMLVDAADVDTLINHLRRVITDETNKLSSRVLFEFVGKYQLRAIEAGVDDLDRQTQYVLLALYTSGRGVEHPACLELMRHPPQSLDDFYAAMEALPEAVWDAGPPLWEEDRVEI